MTTKKAKKVANSSGAVTTPVESFESFQDQFSVEKTIALIMAGIYKDFVEKRINSDDKRLKIKEHFLQAIS